MLTKSQFKTLFGFAPKRKSKTLKAKKAKKNVKKTIKSKKSSKIGTRVIKGVKRTVYKGKNGGKYYKKANGSKVYFGPVNNMLKFVQPSLKAAASNIPIGAGLGLGAGATWGAGQAIAKMAKKTVKRASKSAGLTKMGKRNIGGKSRVIYKSKSGAKFYKKANGTKVYFGTKKVARKSVRKSVRKSARKTVRKSVRRSRFGYVNGADCALASMGPF